VGRGIVDILYKHEICWAMRQVIVFCQKICVTAAEITAPISVTASFSVRILYSSIEAARSRNCIKDVTVCFALYFPSLEDSHFKRPFGVEGEVPNDHR
jgi:hypothetical protein